MLIIELQRGKYLKTLAVVGLLLIRIVVLHDFLGLGLLGLRELSALRLHL